MNAVVIQARGLQFDRVARVRVLFIVGNANPLKRDGFGRRARRLTSGLTSGFRMLEICVWTAEGAFEDPFVNRE
jgi:hypothetical protein